MTRARLPLLRTAMAPLVALAVLCTAAPAQAQARGRPRPPPRPAPASPTSGAAPPPVATIGAKTVEVSVVETAGTKAYVKPGGTAGVHRSSKVTIRGRDYPVIEASDSFAVIEVGDDSLREQDKGRATVVPEEDLKPVELPKPRPATAFEHAWQPEAPPADSQQPRFVPIGGEERNRRYDVRLSIAAGALIPLRGQVGTPFAMGQLNARVHAEPFSAPAAFDLDASLQGWAAADLATRVGGPTRPTVYVRELLASYTVGRFYAGVGRMRYAATTLGTLDGARAQSDLGAGFSLGAFGGLLPNPLSGAPSLDAQRFGVEARYARPDAGIRPEGALVVHGSTFGGSLDEKRVSGMFGLYPGPSRFGGYFEVSSFDANNPWGAKPVELTAAGLDQSIRFGSFELGARFDVRQPERSRWLASFLPSSWFCTTVPAPASNPTQPEPCDGTVNTRAFGEIDASVEVDELMVVVGGTTVRDLAVSNEANMVGGFATARVVRLARVLRLEASGNYSRATYMNLFGGTAGPGITLLQDALDVSAYYRLAVLQYRSDDSTSLTQNGVGGTVVLFPTSTLLFTLQGEGMTGNDTKALMLFGTATWRPRL